MYHKKATESSYQPGARTIGSYTVFQTVNPAPTREEALREIEAAGFRAGSESELESFARNATRYGKIDEGVRRVVGLADVIPVDRFTDYQEWQERQDSPWYPSSNWLGGYKFVPVTGSSLWDEGQYLSTRRLDGERVFDELERFSQEHYAFLVFPKKS